MRKNNGYISYYNTKPFSGCLKKNMPLTARLLFLLATHYTTTCKQQANKTTQRNATRLLLLKRILRLIMTSGFGFY